jgi:hypothetical protein
MPWWPIGILPSHEGTRRRRRRTNRVGQKWQPLGNRRGLVIGNVLDPWGRRGWSAASVAVAAAAMRVKDQIPAPLPTIGILPPLNRVEERGAAAKRCSWPVERSIAQSDRFDAFCIPKGRFQVTNRIQRPARCRRGIGIQWIVLRLDGSAGPRRSNPQSSARRFGARRPHARPREGCRCPRSAADSSRRATATRICQAILVVPRDSHDSKHGSNTLERQQQRGGQTK